MKPSASGFTPIQFVIKAKKGSRKTAYNCEMIAAQGIVVKTLLGNTVMQIRLPDNSHTSMGKILHPAGPTLYKVYFKFIVVLKLRLKICKEKRLKKQLLRAKYGNEILKEILNFMRRKKDS